MDMQGLGDLFAAASGNPIDRAGMELAATQSRGAAQLRSAQTETAFAEARKKRAESQALEREENQRAQFKDTLAPLLGEELATQLAAAANAGLGNWDQLTQGAGNLQDMGMRRTIGDPNTAPEVASAAKAALAPGTYQRFRTEGNTTVDDASGTAPVVNEIGKAQIDNYKEQSAASKSGGSALPGVVKSSNGVAYEKQPDGSWKPLADSANAGKYAAEIASARATGKATGEAKAALGSTLQDADKLTGDIENLLLAKGFDQMYGLNKVLDPRQLVPGTDVSNALSRLKNIDAQTFGVAVAKMRGLGQLSNAEGLKVTDAFTRANNRSQSDEEARKAWRETLEWIKFAKANAIRKADGLDPLVMIPDAAPAAGAPLVPGAPAAPGAVKSFATEAEAHAAEAAGTLKKGERVTVGGVSGSWQ